MRFGIWLRIRPHTTPSSRSRLTHATKELVVAFDVLAHPDASGARTDARPLDDARAQLELAMWSGQPGPDSTRPVTRPPTKDHDEQTSDEQDVWTPTVDDDMVDMFVDEANERLEGLSQEAARARGAPRRARPCPRYLSGSPHGQGFVGHWSGLETDETKPRARRRRRPGGPDPRRGSRQADRLLIDALLAALDGLRAILGLAIKRSPIKLDLAPVMARLRNPAAVAMAAAPA